jgi:hypothetical protein
MIGLRKLLPESEICSLFFDNLGTLRLGESAAREP